MKPFMQASGGPPAPPGPGAPGGGPNPPAPPITGATPALGNGDPPVGAPIEAVGAAPLPGGNAGSLAGGAACPGSGAGNAPCANAAHVGTDSARSVSGTIRRCIIKASSLRQGPQAHECSEIPKGRSDSPVRLFYDSCRALTTRRLGQ